MYTDLSLLNLWGRKQNTYESKNPKTILSRFTHFGSWNKDLGLTMILSQKWELRKDLTDVQFKTASTHDPPFVSLELAETSLDFPYKYWLDSDSSGSPVYLGPSLYGDIWAALQRITNFSYSMVWHDFISSLTQTGPLPVTDQGWHLVVSSSLMPQRQKDTANARTKCKKFPEYGDLGSWAVSLRHKIAGVSKILIASNQSTVPTESGPVR